MSQLNDSVIIKRAAKTGPINYALGKVYKIVNSVNDKVYIGSTCSTLSRRFAEHKCNSKTQPQLFYKGINEIGIENFKIVLIENYPCQDRNELEAREYELTNGYNKDLLYNSRFDGKPLITEEGRQKLIAHLTGKPSRNFKRGCISVFEKHSHCVFAWKENGVARKKTFKYAKIRTKEEAYMLCIDWRNIIFPLANIDYLDELPFKSE